MPQVPPHLQWQKSSRCATNACVEVAEDLGSVYLRDAKNPAGPHLRVSTDTWRTFIRGVQDGSYDPPAQAR